MQLLGRIFFELLKETVPTPVKVQITNYHFDCDNLNVAKN